MHVDRQTDRHVTKVIGTFRYYANWPERELKLCSCQIFSFIDPMLIYIIWLAIVSVLLLLCQIGNIGSKFQICC